MIKIHIVASSILALKPKTDIQSARKQKTVRRKSDAEWRAAHWAAAKRSSATGGYRQLEESEVMEAAGKEKEKEGLAEVKMV